MTLIISKYVFDMKKKKNVEYENEYSINNNTLMNILFSFYCLTFLRVSPGNLFLV